MSSDNWAENFKDQGDGEIDRIEVIRDFLLEVLETVPEELEERVRSFRRTAVNLHNTLENAQTDLNKVTADLKIFRDELAYLVDFPNPLQTEPI